MQGLKHVKVCDPYRIIVHATVKQFFPKFFSQNHHISNQEKVK